MKRNITFMFRPGGGDRDVTRSATAKWGSLGTSTGTFPIAISTCAYSLGAGGIPGTLPSAEITMHGNQQGCNGGPGQFGFLQGGCSTTATVNANGTIPGTTGNNLNGTGCSESDLVRYMTTDAFGFGVGNVLIPVWDSYSGGYHIAGFAMFHLTGYSLQGNKAGGTLGASTATMGSEAMTPRNVSEETSSSSLPSMVRPAARRSVRRPSTSPANTPRHHQGTTPQ